MLIHELFALLGRMFAELVPFALQHLVLVFEPLQLRLKALAFEAMIVFQLSVWDIDNKHDDKNHEVAVGRRSQACVSTTGPPAPCCVPCLVKYVFTVPPESHIGAQRGGCGVHFRVWPARQSSGDATANKFSAAWVEAGDCIQCTLSAYLMFMP